jgi:hypothetical protein
MVVICVSRAPAHAVHGLARVLFVATPQQGGWGAVLGS